MGDIFGIGGVAQAAAQVVAANIAAKNQQAIAQQQADAQQHLYDTSFKNQTSYIQNQEQSGRNAISQAARQFGNPYVNAQSYMRPPEPMQAPASGHFGGGVFNGSGYATGLSGSSNPMMTPQRRPPLNGTGAGLSTPPPLRFGGGESRLTNFEDPPPPPNNPHPGTPTGGYGGGRHLPGGPGAPSDPSRNYPGGYYSNYNPPPDGSGGPARGYNGGIRPIMGGGQMQYDGQRAAQMAAYFRRNAQGRGGQPQSGGERGNERGYEQGYERGGETPSQPTAGNAFAGLGQYQPNTSVYQPQDNIDPGPAQRRPIFGNIQTQPNFGNFGNRTIGLGGNAGTTNFPGMM